MIPMSRWWLMSFSCATGRTRRSTNSRTVSWMARCSSVRSKSTKTLPSRAAAAQDPTLPPAQGASGRGAGAGHAAGRLVGVHRLVGAPEEPVGVAAVRGTGGDAEAGREAGQALVGRRRHRAADAIHHRVRLVEARLGEHEGELVAADPVD